MTFILTPYAIAQFAAALVSGAGANVAIYSHGVWYWVALAALMELELPGASLRHCDMRVSPLVDRRGNPAGRLLLIRDVTERRKVELERERLIGELQDALADIRTLRGLLPICASCKKIRDDEGYWRNLEQYVTADSEAQFSHGLCPDYTDGEPEGSPR